MGVYDFDTTFENAYCNRFTSEPYGDLLVKSFSGSIRFRTVVCVYSRSLMGLKLCLCIGDAPSSLSASM